MSDYLDNLVAKSLGLAEVVRPRPLSLFEPLQPAGSFAADGFSPEQDGAQAEVPDTVDSMIKGAKPPVPKTGEPQSHPPSDRPVQVHNRNVSQSTPKPIPDQHVLTASVIGDAAKRATELEYTASAGQQSMESHPVVSEPAPWRVVLQAAIPADGPSTPTQEATRHTPAHIAAQHHARAQLESIVREPLSRTLLIAPVITPMDASHNERQIPLPGRAAPIPPVLDAQRDAPTIKITIGRVDVRAVMPERPAPRPAPERRNPALSLEEYLKQRSGGRP